MPVTDCEGWPYPTLGNLFQRVHICDLAAAMDASLKAAQNIADLLVTKPTCQVTRTAGQNIVVATPTLIIFDTANDDPYGMWNNLMGPGITDRVFVRPPHGGNWFVRASISSGGAKTTMTNYLIEIITIDPTGAIVVQSARHENGTMETGSGTGLVGDTISALVSLQPHDAVAIRFTWNGTVSPYAVNARLEMALLSTCDDGNVYYNDWEDATTTGWTAVNGAISNSFNWFSWGARSLLLTPTGGFATASALGPAVLLPPHIGDYYAFYAGIVRTGAAVGAGPIRLGLDFLDAALAVIGSASTTITPLAINTTYRATTGPYLVTAASVYVRPKFIIEGTPTAVQIAYFDQTTVARACSKGTLT